MLSLNFNKINQSNFLNVSFNCCEISYNFPLNKKQKGEEKAAVVYVYVYIRGIKNCHIHFIVTCLKKITFKTKSSAHGSPFLTTMNLVYFSKKFFLRFFRWLYAYGKVFLRIYLTLRPCNKQLFAIK